MNVRRRVGQGSDGVRMRKGEEGKGERKVRVRERPGGGRAGGKEEEKRRARPSVTFFPVCFSTMSLLRENSSCCGVLEHPPLGIVLHPSLDLHLYGHCFIINRLLQKRGRRLKFGEKQNPGNLKLMLTD